jgi:hypothetical protein
MTDHNFDYDLHGPHRDLVSEQKPDTAGYWFIAAVLFAFIAAGVIVYRAGTATDMQVQQTAANYSSHPASQSSQLNPHPLLRTR